MLNDILEGLKHPINAVVYDFEGILRKMKIGKMVRRQSWSEKGMCIFLIKGRKIDYNTFQKFKNNACQAFDPPKDVVIKDHIDMKDANGEYVTGWTPSQEDMLAYDWIALR